MQILIDKQDLNDAEEFVQSGGLVDLMNDWGLSVNSMAIILNSLFEGFDTLRTQMAKENEENATEI